MSAAPTSLALTEKGIIMSGVVYYFAEHSHSCECGGWRHEAVDCDLPMESPCPMCEMEEGLLPCTSGTKLGADPFEGYTCIAGSEEVYL